MSLLLADRAALIDVSRAAGHSSPTVTARIYAHLVKEDQLTYLSNTFDGIDGA